MRKPSRKRPVNCIRAVAAGDFARTQSAAPAGPLRGPLCASPTHLLCATACSRRHAHPLLCLLYAVQPRIASNSRGLHCVRAVINMCVCCLSQRKVRTSACLNGGDWTAPQDWRATSPCPASRGAETAASSVPAASGRAPAARGGRRPCSSSSSARPSAGPGPATGGSAATARSTLTGWFEWRRVTFCRAPICSAAPTAVLTTSATAVTSLCRCSSPCRCGPSPTLAPCAVMQIPCTLCAGLTGRIWKGDKRSKQEDGQDDVQSTILEVHQFTEILRKNTDNAKYRNSERVPYNTGKH